MKKQLVPALLVLPVGISVSMFAMRHHVPVALSHVRGAEILTSAKLFLGNPDVGVPPIVVSTEEFEGTFDLAPGESFTVTTTTLPGATVDATGAKSRNGGSNSGHGNGDGDDDHDHGNGGRGHHRGHGRDRQQTSRITFRRSQFVDIHNATPDEIIDAISEQLTNATVYEDNGHLVMVGNKPGETAQLTIANRNGTPIDKIALPADPTTGSTPVELVLSIPATDDPAFNFAGDRYRFVVSTTAGSSVVDGITVPLQIDAATTTFDTLAGSGQLPGFTGNLDANDDGAALLSADAVALAFGATPPAQLFLAYIVYDELNQAEYVSNVFTVDIAQ